MTYKFLLTLFWRIVEQNVETKGSVLQSIVRWKSNSLHGCWVFLRLISLIGLHHILLHLAHLESPASIPVLKLILKSLLLICNPRFCPCLWCPKSIERSLLLLFLFIGLLWNIIYFHVFFSTDFGSFHFAEVYHRKPKARLDSEIPLLQRHECRLFVPGDHSRSGKFS